MRRLPTAVLFAMVAFAVLAFVMLLPSAVWTILGPGPSTFFDQQVAFSSSPDNSYQLIVRRRVDFPVLDLLDPPGTVTIELKRTGALGSRNSIVFPLHEYDEFTPPIIQWKDDRVIVSDIDYHKEYLFSLKYREQE